jgi:uncharacterized protein
MRTRIFDPQRLRLLPRADKLLVMDRISGRWVFTDPRSHAYLRLLPSDLRSIPERLREGVEQVRADLVAEGVGVAGGERRFSDLNTLILKLTSACNLACSYCYDHEREEGAANLTVAQAAKAITEALELAADELWVILHGGEPMLMWPRIESIVTFGMREAARQGKRIRFSGQSNFTRLDDRIVEFSSAHDIAWGVSLDGWAGLNDCFRVDHKGGGSFRLFLDAYEKYPDFVSGLGVMSTITAVNEHRLVELAGYFRDLGMASWDWSLFQPIGRGREARQSYQPTLDRLIPAWNELLDDVIDGAFDGFPVLAVRKYIDNFVYGPSGNMCLRPQCGAARDLLSVSADGRIEACDCIDPTGTLAGLGHVDTGTLDDACRSQVADIIRGRDMSSHPQCGGCIWFGVCGGTCLAHAQGIDALWSEGCALALTAFDRISDALASGDAIQRYLNSLVQ